jgi:hypothetical protein
MFLYRQAARLTGNENIMKQPYPVRIEKYGWDAYGLWSSIYPWIASDVSFPGTILIVYLIGRLFALSWLQSGEGFTAFWVTLFLWLRTRHRQDPARQRVLAKSAETSLGSKRDGPSKSME